MTRLEKYLFSQKDIFLSSLNVIGSSHWDGPDRLPPATGRRDEGHVFGIIAQ